MRCEVRWKKQEKDGKRIGHLRSVEKKVRKDGKRIEQTGDCTSFLSDTRSQYWPRAGRRQYNDNDNDKAKDNDIDNDKDKDNDTDNIDNG